MKLLLDENLSPKLASSLAAVFPGSRHVEDCGLGAADDEDIWAFAKENGFVIASKDSDFYDRSALYGSPPKVIWLRAGNCTTAEIEDLLRRFQSEIDELAGSPQTTLIIFPGGRKPSQPE
jgi:predicted nuclease of predicted toxin-antitoxin system